MMSINGRILLAGIGSLGILLGAVGFQYIGELAPCPMCIWQRWPHAVAIVLSLGALSFLSPLRRALAALGALTMAVSAGLGLFHAGVEQKWWDGPTTCVGIDPAGVSTDELFDRLMDAPLVRCDEIVWDLFGITMAGWNGLISLGLVVLWVYAALGRMPGRP